MQTNRAMAVLLRVMAAVIFIIAVMGVSLPTERFAHIPHLAAWLATPIAIAAALALLSLAWLIRRQGAASPEVSAALARLQQQLMELQQKLDDLQLMSGRAARPAQPVAPPVAAKDYTVHLQQLASAIEEVRELSLLPDAERRQRLHIYRQQRKATLIKDLFGLVAAHEWPKAERLLITLETEFPNDDEVAKGRSYLHHSRKLFEEETVQRSTAEIEELMAGASWEQAWDRARQLVQGFPESGDARALLTRVEQERETFNETTAGRLFEDIRADIDRRIWRRALQNARHLIEEFPQHRLAERIRGQIKTLEDNAEIEERQELEVRIQELVRAGQFAEGIELAEEVIHRFPLSPQAESLETLLPRIRELARQGNIPGESVERSNEAVEEQPRG